MLRWLLANKDQNTHFRNVGVENRVLEAIVVYLQNNTELKKVDLTGEVILNNQAIIKNIEINDQSKFDLLQASFSLDEYLTFGEKESNSFGVNKKGTGRLYYDLGLKYFLPIEEIAARDEGIIVNREYYNYQEYLENQTTVSCPPYFRYFSKMSMSGCLTEGKTTNLESIKEGQQGDYIVGKIEIILPTARNNVVVDNFIPAGAAIVNTNFETTSSAIKEITAMKSKGGYYWRPNFDLVEVKDEQLLLYTDHLEAGSYSYTYVLQLQHKGQYHHRPAVSYEMKKPEVWGRSEGSFFEIK